MAVANPPAGKTGATVITDARSGTSSDLTSRQKRYAITMAFRTACFIAMIFVPGVFRWILFGGAVFLPYVAVIFANQTNSRRSTSGAVEKGEPEPAPQLTQGDQHESTYSDVIDGDIDADIDADIKPEAR